MASMAVAPEGVGEPRMLDSTPPSPRSPSIASLARRPEAATGPEAGSPQMQALQGLQFMERGAQMLATTFPEMAPQLAQLVGGLRQAIPQAMAGSMGGSPAGGMSPMMPPPGA